MKTMNKKDETLKQVRDRLSMREPLVQCLKVIAEITDELSLEKSPTNGKEQEAFLEDELAKAQKVVPSLYSFERKFPSLTCSIATGIGKTRLMAAAIYYLHQAHGIKHFFILAPNLTLYNKLLRDFGDPSYDKYVFKGLAEYVTHPPKVITGENYLSIRTNPSDQQLFQFDGIEINIFNIDKFNSDNQVEKKGRKKLAPRMKRLSEYLGTSYYDYLASLPKLVVLMDEAHRYYADASSKVIDELSPVLGIEMTATPLRDGQPVGNIIYEYNLAQALKDGLYVKIPTIATRANFSCNGLPLEEIERIKLEDGLSIHIQTKASLEKYAKDNNKPHVKPFVLVVCRDIDHASKTVEYLESDSFYSGVYRGKVLQIDSSTKKEDDLAQLFLSVEENSNPIEIVVHVNMLGEGWDVRNLYTIIPLRAANARTLIEQTIGRGLRLPFEGKRTGEKDIDTLTIIAHDNFEKIIYEAKGKDSILNCCDNIRLNKEDLDPNLVNIITIQPKVYEPLVEYQLQASRAATPEEKEKAQASYDAVEVLLSVLSTVAIETNSASIEKIACDDKNLELLANKAKEAIKESSSSVASLAREQLSTEFVKATIDNFKRNFIEIPHISTPPKEICYKLMSFKVDFSQGEFDLEACKKRIVRHDLVSDQQDFLEIIDSSQRQDVKSLLLSRILRYSDINYGEMKNELMDVVNQVYDHVLNYSSNHQDAVNMLDQYSEVFAEHLYKQIQKHIVKEEVLSSYGEAKVLPFVRIEPINLGERTNYPRKTLNAEGVELNQIRRFIFYDFKKACHECYSFDSGSERDFAKLLERDEEVVTWMRPAATQFNIYWGNGSHRYEPDFVVETKDHIYLVEIKAEDNLATEEVKAKAKAARQYCALATDYTTKHGGKPWDYILISHSKIKSNSTFEGIRSQSERN